MARIDIADAQAWAEPTKLNVAQLDAALVGQVETQVLTRLSTQLANYVSIWVDTMSTPAVVKSVIAMYYVSWLYDRQYSEDQENGNDYAALLRTNADNLMAGLLDGSIPIPGTTDNSAPAFYPTDASSALCATNYQPHLGPEKFQMGWRF